MTTAPSLIPELDDTVSHGDPKRRADAPRKVSEVFLQGAPYPPHGYCTRTDRARQAGEPTLRTGQRREPPAEQLDDPLAPSTDGIRRRLDNTGKPTKQRARTRAINEISGVTAPPESSR